MELENGVTLLILQLDSEFCQHTLELLNFDQTTVLFERIDLHVLEQLDPVLWVLFDHLLVYVLVQAKNFHLALLQMGHAEGRLASHGGPTICEGASVSIKLQTL